jgi:hypothetical protein
MRLGRAGAQAALTSSLLMGVCCLALAGPYSDLHRALTAARTPAQIKAVLDNAGQTSPELNDSINDYEDSNSDRERAQALERINSLTLLGTKAEEMPTDSSAQGMAKSIKSSPLYHDQKPAQSNWWERSLDGFYNWLSKLFANRDKSKAESNAPAILGPWVVYMMWTILGCLVLFFVVLAARHFKWKLTLKRKSKALLSDDEPERTLDEWLERADALEAEGKHREAVRCLYLACLMRFDEARVARFDRGQTNWEHLRRIQQCATLPPGTNFEPPTQAFDRIWYGMATRGAADVRQFRNWYAEISNALLEKAA